MAGGEIAGEQMLLAAQYPHTQSSGFLIVADLPLILAALKAVAEPPPFLACPSKVEPLIVPAFD